MTSILKVSEIQDPTNSNTALTIDSSGHVTTPAKPAFSVSGLGSNFTIISGAETKLPFQGTPTVNIGNHYSNGTFTAPVAGVYWIQAYALILLSGGNNATLIIKRSGLKIIEGRAKNTQENQVSVEGVVSCSVGDTIEIFASCDASNSLLYQGYNIFNGYLIG